MTLYLDGDFHVRILFIEDLHQLIQLRLGTRGQRAASAHKLNRCCVEVDLGATTGLRRTFNGGAFILLVIDAVFMRKASRVGGHFESSFTANTGTGEVRFFVVVFIFNAHQKIKLWTCGDREVFSDIQLEKNGHRKMICTSIIQQCADGF